MCILIEISIKIYFINLAAGNGPKIHNARVNTHTAYTHTRRRCTRTLVNAHTRRLHTHALERTHATSAHAQYVTANAHETSRQRAIENAHTRRSRTHTIRRHAGTLVRKRTRHARTRDVHATHAPEHTHTHTRRPRANAIMHARTRTHRVEGEMCRN